MSPDESTRPQAAFPPEAGPDEGPAPVGGEPEPPEPMPEPMPEPPPEPTPEEVAAALAVERDRYLDSLQRLKAEFDNYRKRADRERRALVARSGREVVTELLPVMDNLERAADAMNGQDPGLLAGVEMVRDQLLRVLGSRGVAEIEATGAEFNPTVHEAVLSHPTPDFPAGTVMEVVQKGYVHADDVLRPARVVVAAELPTPPSA